MRAPSCVGEMVAGEDAAGSAPGGGMGMVQAGGAAGSGAGGASGAGAGGVSQREEGGAAAAGMSLITLISSYLTRC